MDDAAHNDINIVPLIPVLYPSPRGSRIGKSSSVRNSPSLLRGPITPTPPRTILSSMNQGTISLRMPNIATTRPLTSPVNIHRTASTNNNNNVTIPSNLITDRGTTLLSGNTRVSNLDNDHNSLSVSEQQRCSRPMIPSDINDRNIPTLSTGNKASRSPVNILGSVQTHINNVHTQPVISTVEQPCNEVTPILSKITSDSDVLQISTVSDRDRQMPLQLEVLNGFNPVSISDEGQTNTASPIVRLPSSPATRSRSIVSASVRDDESRTLEGQSPSSSSKQIPIRTCVNKIEPPVILVGTPSIQTINKSVNTELSAGIALPPSTTNPIIKPEDLVPINDRPASPRDMTGITLHGIPLDRGAIMPIQINTDSDDETETTDTITTDARPNDLINISARPPDDKFLRHCRWSNGREGQNSNIVSTTIETTTDTTDETEAIIRTLNGPMISSPPRVSQLAKHTVEDHSDLLQLRPAISEQVFKLPDEQIPSVLPIFPTEESLSLLGVTQLLPTEQILSGLPRETSTINDQSNHVSSDRDNHSLSLFSPNSILPVELTEGDIVIRPASPTTQVNVPTLTYNEVISTAGNISPSIDSNNNFSNLHTEHGSVSLSGRHQMSSTHEEQNSSRENHRFSNITSHSISIGRTEHNSNIIPNCEINTNTLQQTPSIEQLDCCHGGISDPTMKHSCNEVTSTLQIPLTSNTNNPLNPLISPAPPTTSLTRADQSSIVRTLREDTRTLTRLETQSTVSQSANPTLEEPSVLLQPIQPPIATRIPVARGRQQIPSSVTQPTPIQAINTQSNLPTEQNSAMLPESRKNSNSEQNHTSVQTIQQHMSSQAVRQSIPLNSIQHQSDNIYSRNSDSTHSAIRQPISTSSQHGPIPQIFSTRTPSSQTVISHLPTSQKDISHVPSSRLPVSQVPLSQVPASQVSSSQIPTSRLPVSQLSASQVSSSQISASQLPVSQVSSSHVPVSQVSSSRVPASQIPTSQAQVSQIPTGQVPVSEIPTDQSSVSQIPTAQAQVSQIPTAQAQVSQIPTSQAQVSQIPTAQAQISQIPTSQAQVSQIPTAQAPTSQIPTAQAPISQIPNAQAPVSQIPNAQAPVSQIPNAQAPVSQIPNAQAPVSQIPNAQAPVSQIPNAQAPVSQITNTQASVSQFRQHIPVNSVTQGIRQPVPLNSTMSGIRQPTPITTVQQGNRQPTPTAEIRQSVSINNGITGTNETRPVSERQWDSTSTQQRSHVKDVDTQPVPNEPAMHGQLLQITPLPAPNVPQYSEMTPEEQAQHRANFRTRFGILRGAWPNYHIPDIPDNMPLEQVHAQYDIYVRHIHISRDVDQYKVYLVIMWLLIELFCIKIGLNIGGYTVAQMRSMNKYERLLIELGETNYKSASTEISAQSNWPVEVRILFMALVNAVTFIIIKMLSNWIGEGMATTIIDGLSSYLSGSPPQPGQVLFGGPSSPNIQTSGGPPPGGSPLPQVGGPFGGIDVASLLGNFGSMFLRGQTPLAGNDPQTSTAPTVQPSIVGPQTPTTPRFRPAYNE